MAKILIIDDDQQVCRVVSEGLRRQGHEVTSAPDGDAGLLAAAAVIPDLILCDLDMPGLDGQGVVSALRRDRRLGEIPLIFLSACLERDQIRRSMNLGGDDFISKPAPWPEILAAVNARLGRRQKQLQKMDQQVETAAKIFVGLIHDLKQGGTEVRWLADAATGTADQQNRIIQRVQESLSENHSPATSSPSVPSQPASVLIKDGQRQQLLKLSEVKALLADGEYSNIYWGKDQHLMFRKPLKQWAVELPSEQFIRVHRQAIVNLAFLDFVDKDSEGRSQIHLREFKQVIPISQRATPNFNRCLNQFRTRQG
ncbi:MAG TPA: response regulator transcription factor [Verrucomicrobiae bacterium]|nr:response regulator transcription factor [Verrucomicrobiae bacterium]